MWGASGEARITPPELSELMSFPNNLNITIPSGTPPKMTPKISSPTQRIPITPLNPIAFNAFGTVIENPSTSPHPSPTLLQSEQANQGTAIRYLDVSHLINYYPLAPSKKPARAVMNMFSCSPRQLRASSSSSSQSQLFDVNILERHPYTPQTFIPLGISPNDPSARYLVIVAPTLPTSKKGEAADRPKPYPTPEPRKKRSLLDIFSRARPAPFTNELAPPAPTHGKDDPSGRIKGRGMPDLRNMKAFIATGNQAVTYAAGTWHAPMAALGDRPIDFVVIQYNNGIPVENCEEVLLEKPDGEPEGIAVEVNHRFDLETENPAIKSKL